MNSYRKVSETASITGNMMNKFLPDDLIAYLKSLLGLTKRNNGGKPSFQSMFSSYRKVLENSNRAIGIISDMNHRLGEDSPAADMAYVKSTYSALRLVVETAMNNFDMFTQYKYMKLHDVLSGIDIRINQILNGVISGDLPEPAHSPSAEALHMDTDAYGKKILGYIAPLHLVDPMFDNFTPEGCKTIHDIIRFMHAKSVRQLAKHGNGNQSSVPEHLSPAMR